MLEGGVGGGGLPGMPFVQGIRIGRAQRGFRIAARGDVQPRRHQHDRCRHPQPSVAHLENGRGGQPAAGRVPVDGRVREALAVASQRLDRRDDLIGHLVVFGERRERVVDGDHAEPCFVGGDDGTAEGGCGARHHVGATVGVDEDLAVVRPVFGTHVQHRDSAQTRLPDGVLVALETGRGRRRAGRFCEGLHLLPAGQVSCVGERGHERRIP